MSNIVNFEGKSYFECLKLAEEYLKENRLKVHVVSTNVTVIDGLVNILLTIEQNNIEI